MLTDSERSSGHWTPHNGKSYNGKKAKMGILNRIREFFSPRRELDHPDINAALDIYAQSQEIDEDIERELRELLSNVGVDLLYEIIREESYRSQYGTFTKISDERPGKD